MKRAIICLSVMASLAAAVAGYASQRDSTGHTDPRSAAAKSQSRDFQISGQAKGLFPGIRGHLTLMLTNPHAFPIAVTSVGVVVGPGGPECAGDNVLASHFHGRLEVRPRDSRKLRLAIKLIGSAPPACEGARFPLHFKGRAEKP